MTKYSITASRAQLAKALALATIGVRKGINFEIRFSLKDGLPDIMGPGAARSVPAQGVCFTRTLNWQQPATRIELVYTVLQIAKCRIGQSRTVI
jgi:hypothetical protein